MHVCVCVRAYLGLQKMQQRENGEEATQSVSHVLLHHLPPDAQTDESHQAECLEADGGACLHPAGEPEHSRTSTELMTKLLQQYTNI